MVKKPIDSNFELLRSIGLRPLLLLFTRPTCTSDFLTKNLYGSGRYPEDCEYHNSEYGILFLDLKLVKQNILDF
jgi:hypothetical protein